MHSCVNPDFGIHATFPCTNQSIDCPTHQPTHTSAHSPRHPPNSPCTPMYAYPIYVTSQPTVPFHPSSTDQSIHSPNKSSTPHRLSLNKSICQPVNPFRLSLSQRTKHFISHIIDQSLNSSHQISQAFQTVRPSTNLSTHSPIYCSNQASIPSH